MRLGVKVMKTGRVLLIVENSIGSWHPFGHFVILTTISIAKCLSYALCYYLVIIVSSKSYEINYILIFDLS